MHVVLLCNCQQLLCRLNDTLLLSSASLTKIKLVVKRKENIKLLFSHGDYTLLFHFQNKFFFELEVSRRLQQGMIWLLQFLFFSKFRFFQTVESMRQDFSVVKKRDCELWV